MLKVKYDGIVINLASKARTEISRTPVSGAKIF